MEEKYEVWLQFFSGFYNSIHDEAMDREVEYILEDSGLEYDDYKFTYDYLGYSQAYIKKISKVIGIDFEFEELNSPKEYNFGTDHIYCYIGRSDLVKISSVANSETMKRLVKERFTSRDGFISFYSPYISVWLDDAPIENWDAVQLGVLLDAYIIESGEDLDDIDMAGYEYCSENGQWVDYDLVKE